MEMVPCYCHYGKNVAVVFCRQTVYGENAIDIEVKSYWRLLIEEVSAFSVRMNTSVYRM